MLNEISFVRRTCPFCGDRQRTPIINLSSENIISANWSYKTKENLPTLGVPANHEIVRCAKCDFVYAGLLPSQKFLSFVYDELIVVEAARHESFSPHNIASRMEYLPSLLRLLGSGGKVLDYGCGFGPTLALLRNIGGVETVGFETSTARVQELNDWYPLVTSDFDRVQAHGPFNAVILDNVLEHVPDPRHTVSSIGKICAEGAFLYVSVPDMSSRYLGAQMALHRQEKLLSMDINPWEHLNYFDIAHLDALLSAAGFVALRQVDLAADVSIGLRPEKRLSVRLKNCLASVVRCGRFLVTGDAIKTTNRRFYRLKKDGVC